MSTVLIGMEGYILFQKELHKEFTGVDMTEEGERTLRNRLRGGTYIIADDYFGWQGFKCPERKDGQHAVTRQNDDGTLSYFIDYVKDGYCHHTLRIEKDEFERITGKKV